MFEKLTTRGDDVTLLAHARSIMLGDFPDAISEIEDVVSEFAIPITEIVGSGGGEALGTQRMRRALAEKGWVKRNFEIKKIINGVQREAISHEVDHVKEYPNGVLALEIEWNNKDPFFDRDLENFKRLHAEGAISVGIIITRGSLLQNALRSAVARFAEKRQIDSVEKLFEHGIDRITTRQRANLLARQSKYTFSEAWAGMFVSDKYGEATTHWRKLEDRVSRGVGNPCPLILIGLSDRILRF
jgi:hypothetical protein